MDQYKYRVIVTTKIDDEYKEVFDYETENYSSAEDVYDYIDDVYEEFNPDIDYVVSFDSEHKRTGDKYNEKTKSYSVYSGWE